MNAVAKRETETQNGTSETVEYVTPAVNIYQTEDGYQLEADVPGVGRDGVEISLDRNELTLIARRSNGRPEHVHYRESTEHDYRRVFELDPQIDTDRITARVEAGVLTLNLAKRENAKPRKIAVAD